MTTETEALRAEFERDFGKLPYELTLSRFPEKSAWAGQYTELKTQCGWEGYQAGHAAAKAETAAPVAGRWYFVTNDGAATLCVDEADARESAAEADIAFPRMAPHLVTQLVSASQLAAAVADEREKHQENSLMAECMDMVRDDLIRAGIISEEVPPMMLPEAIKRALKERVEAEREKCAQACDRRVMGDNNREDSEARRCADAIRARAKEPSDG